MRKEIFVGVAMALALAQSAWAEIRYVGPNYGATARGSAREGLRPAVSLRDRGKASQNRQGAAEAAAKATPWTAFTDDAVAETLRQVDMELGGDARTAREYAAGMISINGITLPRALANYLVPSEERWRVDEKYQIPGKDGVRIFGLTDIDPTKENYKTGWITWHKLVRSMSVDEFRKLILFPLAVRTNTGPYGLDLYDTLKTIMSTESGYTGNYSLRTFWRTVLISEKSSPMARELDEPTFRPEFGEFYRAMFAGNVEACKATVNKVVTDADLAAARQFAAKEVKALAPRLVKTKPAGPAREVTW